MPKSQPTTLYMYSPCISMTFVPAAIQKKALLGAEEIKSNDTFEQNQVQSTSCPIGMVSTSSRAKLLGYMAGPSHDRDPNVLERLFSFFYPLSRPAASVSSFLLFFLHCI